MRRVLERQGYRVLEAGTGEQGLAQIRDHMVGVVVLDVNLPDMSGFDIVRRLRADPITALLPIVHVSAASTHTRDLVTGLEGGADGYLVHPVDPAVLRATVRTLLRVRAAEDALREREARVQAQRLDTAHTQLAEEISARERTELQLVQAQKMDALGQLSGGIAHDFNNLLTGIIASLGLLVREIDDGSEEGARRYAATAMDAARRAASLTHRLLAFARQQPLDARAVDVNARVLSLQELLRRTIGEQVALRFDLDPGAGIASVDANQLENAVLNLAVNARDALPDGGTICIATRRAQVREADALQPGGYVEVSVGDNGTGIPADVIDKVFDPFFTTKPIGQGTGLGLSMTYGFARQSGGTARIESVPGEGTTVTLLLPLADTRTLASEPARAPVDGAEMAGHGETILIVEDSDSVRELTATLLHKFGYRCLSAADVESALAILRGPETVDLLLTDVGLPGMNGRQLADAARAWRPALPVLFLTGYAKHSVAIGAFLGENMDMMTKPYDAELLLARIARMVARPA
jgi:signal transduction histidine kinase